MARRIAIVTDSSSSLGAELAAAYDIGVIPLQVVIGDDSYAEGIDITPAEVAAALQGRQKVSTSRPAPEVFARTYAQAAEAGCDAVISVHLSSEVSGTYESAQIAGREAEIAVHCVDSRQVGLGTAFAAMTAASLIDAGESVERAVEGATARGEKAAVFFYVDTLEHLRRGGRVGTLGALVGSALAVKPLLGLRDGLIRPLEKVRTSGRALRRLEELAIECARQAPGADVAVQHLASPDRAEAIAGSLRETLGLREVMVAEVGAAIGAHVGPGLLAIIISPK